MNHNTLIHSHTHVGIESSHVLEIIHLTLEQGKVISKHLPVKLFSNKLVSFVFLVLWFPSIVDVTVELNEFVPLLHVLSHVVVILLTDVKEVLSWREIVHHHCSSNLVEKLLLEVLGFIEELLELLWFLWQHVVLGFIKVVSDFVHLLDHSWIFYLPLLVILLFKEAIFLGIDNFLSSQVLLFRSQNEEVRLLETSSTLFSLILELSVQTIVDHEPLVHCQFSSHPN